MTLREILKERIDLLDSSPTFFADNVEASQKQIFNQILDKLRDLNIDENGIVLPTNNNLAMIKELGKELQAIIQNPDNKYMKAVAEFTKDFLKSKDLTKTFFKKAFDEFENKKSFDAVYNSSVKTATGLVSKSAVSEQVVAFEDMLQTAIGSADSYNNIVKSISDLIQGNDKINGGLSKYAKQNAKDIFAVADRQYSKVISDDLGIQFYEYAGGLIDTSRPFCVKRNGNIYHAKEIEGWADDKWDGKAAGTTTNTIYTLLGGYGCDHVLIPVGLKYVPVDVLNRNIANGNINYDDLPEEIQEKLAA